MSSPHPVAPPAASQAINREDWDKCVRNGTWRVALGLILGAIGSAVVVSEMPMVIGAGLGIGWAVRHCKNILNKTTGGLSKPPEEDPCACCHSNFEALDEHEFDGIPPPPPTLPPPTPPPPPPTGHPPTGPPTNRMPGEEQCTCHEIPASWSPPKPAEGHHHHPVGCSCYR